MVKKKHQTDSLFIPFSDAVYKRTGQTGPFYKRSPDIQEAILMNILCDWCGRLAQCPINPIEFEKDGITWVEATCIRCGKQAKIDVRDVP